MVLELIRVVNLRNISEGLLEPGPGINFIEGPNGSGKTSLLEAIYMLGRGKSFRGNSIGAAIQEDKSALELYGVIVNGRKLIKIGFRKTEKTTEIRINGERVKKLSLLAREVPIHIITPRSHEIVEGGADYRRRFLDWGVFHVEPQYQFVSSRYQRALAQRNAALKRNTESVEHWNFELAETGELVNRMRMEYLETLTKYFHEECNLLLPIEKIELSWKRGWSEKLGYCQALERTIERDKLMGHTTSGPHRADLRITVLNKNANQRLSRGQQKLIVTALILAQSQILKNKTGLHPIVLLDDVASELDIANRDRIINRLREIKLQLFVTTTDLQFARKYPMDRLFHVEHGVVSEEHV